MGLAPIGEKNDQQNCYQEKSFDEESIERPSRNQYAKRYGSNRRRRKGVYEQAGRAVESLIVFRYLRGPDIKRQQLFPNVRFCFCGQLISLGGIEQVTGDMTHIFLLLFL